ncbi:alginate lyase family protein [Sessilibacter corallicola]|uniref:Heparinase n=1 Tax=Sessilibacter corallicola TaxID=2904075 RepID=A0ABQ0A7N7_9GAMM
MNNKGLTKLFLVASILCLSVMSQAQNHPGLILTKSGVEEIRTSLGSVPLFDQTLRDVKEEIDAEITTGIYTPIPKDYSGGYTHERHKRNFIVAQKAGVLFQILQDEKYAKYVRDMLFQYEAMYKDLPVHPQTRSYARGKLFWQCLNDSNWLVFMSQAYDTIYEWLSPNERQQLENNLFRPFADFISLENPQFYNRIHNHSTWGNAAVGMLGLVLDDEELIERALYGIENDGLEAGLKDNDGGFIKVEGQKAGFLANLEEPFSPDGYFTEGPYYQRYAMYPFLIFALAMHNKKPELAVLEHKNGVLMKAVTALLNLSDADGEFFLLNDAQKGMSYKSRELVTAVDIAYYYGGFNPQLLDVAKAQNQVTLDQAGLAVAKDLHSGKAHTFIKKSVNLSDGPDGNQGGVSVIRYGNEDLSLVFKYTAHGLSHGHYDKLSFSLFEHGNEVLQDYGLVRFVNIEQKGGGNYLKENNTWAKQTVAHNTLVQNETSHFNGDYATGSQYHSFLHFYNDDNENIQIVSAKETNAYPGTEFHRTMAMIKHHDFEKPFVLDLLKVSSKRKNQYDLPFYYLGQMIDTNFDYQSPQQLQALGKSNGYQHLYLEGKGSAADDNIQFTWLGNHRYYTLTSVVDQADELLLTRLGANDPKFNLRRDAGFMLRRKNTSNTVFASIIEPHGSYSPVTELSLNSNSNVDRINVVRDDKHYTAVDIKTVNGGQMLLIVANTDANDSKSHRIKISNKTYKWQGPFFLKVN